MQDAVPQPHLFAARCRALLAAVVLLGSGACGDTGGSLSALSLDVPDCAGLGKPKHFEPFVMQLETLSVHEAGGVATLRMASGAGKITDYDQLGLVLYDVDDLRMRLRDGEEVSVALVVGSADGEAFTLADSQSGLMSFVFAGRCGPTTASLAGIGTLVMSAYGDKDGDIVTGSFDIDVLDRRSGRTLGTKVHGDFDFTVSTSSPNTAFAPRDY